MHYYYLPEIDGSEGLSFVIGTTNCLRESCLHKAHVDVRGVSPFTDTAGDMLLSEISLSWLHKEDANIFLAANNSTLLSTHFFFFCFGIHLQNLLSKSKSFSFLYFSFSLNPVRSLVFIFPLLFLLSSCHAYYLYFNASGFSVAFFNNLEGPAISRR